MPLPGATKPGARLKVESRKQNKERRKAGRAALGGTGGELAEGD